MGKLSKATGTAGERDCEDFLVKIVGAIVYKTTDPGHKKTVGGRTFHATSATPGIFDFFVVVPWAGLRFWWDAKNGPRARLSKSQREFMDHVTNCGGVAGFGDVEKLKTFLTTTGIMTQQGGAWRKVKTQ